MITRFAPSPTGHLHAGNIRTALINWLAARSSGGSFVLRIDDTDAARSREEYVEGIRADLAWLGITVDSEARQSARTAAYEAALGNLTAQGRAYRAYESAAELDIKRKIQAGRGRPPVYDRAALALSDADHAARATAGDAPHWRFKLDTAQTITWDDGVRGRCTVDPASLSDPVVRRADGSWLYMLPSVVDDIDLGITTIIRGEDHVTNSGVQLQMFEALGAPVPALAHLALLSGTDAGLSKRHGSEGVAEWRASGIEPLAVVALLARLGTSCAVEPVLALEELLDGFDLAQFGRATARFDVHDLALLSARTVHILPFEAVADRLPAGLTAAVWEAIRPNLQTVTEAGDWWRVIDGDITVDRDLEDREYLAEAHAMLARLPWDAGIWQALTSELKARTGRKGKPLFLPLRRALTGLDHGPEMAALVPLIGRDRALARLAR